jgi:ribosome-binding protein aMBF1 (putative translation factor)
MTRRMIPVGEVAKRWLKDPTVRKAYDEMEEEYAIAGAFIAARARARMTQEQVAKRMGTTQAVVARLESGRVKPSTRTLERFAAATGHRLKIDFEKVRARG